jgi:multiple sugar transport system substrate-binding protein
VKHTLIPRPPLALFTLTGLLLSGGASAQLTLWTTQVQPERIEVQQQIAADFEAETGISVEIVPVEESAMAERVTAAFGAGDLPDVIYHPISQTIGWADAGILDTLTATDIVENLGADTFTEGALNLVRYNEEYAAVPSDGWTQLLVYRQDLFEEAGLEAPTTFEAIQAAVEVLHNPPEMYGFVAATDPSNDYMMQVLEHFFLANGVTLLDDEGNVDLDNERVVETLEFYKALTDASPAGNLFWEQSRELYFAGQAAMIVWSPFILDELAGLRDEVPVTALDDPTGDALARGSGFVTSVAGPSNPDGAGWASASNWGVTVDADFEAAAQFVEFVMNDAYLTWLSLAPEGLFPVRSGTADAPNSFIEGWQELEVGVDRKAPLSSIYSQEVIDNLLAGLEVGDRWAYAQGQGSLISQLYGTRAMAELVREFTDGERSAEETAALLQERVSALQGQ